MIEAVPRVRAWLAEVRARTLNVAGPSEQRQPGITARASRLLDAIFDAAR